MKMSGYSVNLFNASSPVKNGYIYGFAEIPIFSLMGL